MSQYSSLSENATSTTGCQHATTSEHFLSGSYLFACLKWVALPGDIAPVSIIREIRERRLKIAGDCVRHSEEVASNLVLWKLSREKPNRWRERKLILTIWWMILTWKEWLNYNYWQWIEIFEDVWSIIVAAARVGARPNVKKNCVQATGAKRI